MFKYTFRAILFCFCFFSFCAFAARPVSDPIESIVTSNVSPYMQANSIPGVAVGIFYGGQSRYYNYGVIKYGKGKSYNVTENSIFGIGSITKTFTASLLGVCLYENRCALSDTLISHIPQLSNDNALPIGQITLEELATHLSSLPRDGEDLGVNRYSSTALDQIWPALEAWQPEYPIGTNYLYSNLAFYLLSQAVGNINGTTFMDAINQRITGPLGMPDTVLFMTSNQLSRFAQGYNSNGNPVDYLTPTNYLDGRPLLSTTKDMLVYLRANMGDPNTNVSPELLNAFRIAQEVHFQINNNNFLQRLGWTSIVLNNHVLIQKDGGIHGFLSYAVFVPDRNIAAVILVNKAGDSPVPVLRAIVSQLITLSN